MLKKLWRHFGPNPLERQLKKAARKGHKRVLLAWNRGMGDVALGMYALVHRIRHFLPEAQITFIVRKNLFEAFSLLENVEVFAAEHWKRGVAFDLQATLEELFLKAQDFDLILEHPDPTYWVKWQLGTLVPKLKWDETHDRLHTAFAVEGHYIALHVHTETRYGYEKNWQASHWRELAERLVHETGAKILLFGLKPMTSFEMENVIDLRGKTTLLEMLSLLKNGCSHLVAPDSGVLSLLYYVEASFPLRIVSLWADPRQGVLKQNVASPNPQLEHLPLFGKEEKVENITVDEVFQTLAVDIVDPLLLAQRKALFEKKQEFLKFSPLKEGNLPPDKEEGLPLLRAGLAGCILLAGGQGSRLGLHVPKGLVPITPIKGKTLLQYFSEKTKAASLQAGHPLPLAIMTSPINHSLLVEYMEKNHYFGLTKTQVSFFTQEMLPFLDDRGHWVTGAKGTIAKGPDGNGGALKRFYNSDIFEVWKQAGIEHVHVIPIDNPLADPFDASLLAAHTQASAEVTLKCIRRAHSKEKVGMLVLEEGKVRVIEYCELPEDIEHEKGSIAHIGLFCFSMSFIEKVAHKQLPWHIARKGGLFKFETFIFDLLQYAENVKVLVYPREEVYAPLKNASGESSVETVKEALIAQDRRIFHTISGIDTAQSAFELDPIFHYPTNELLEEWKGKTLPDSAYIESMLK